MSDINCTNQEQIINRLNSSISNDLTFIRNFLNSPTVPDQSIPNDIFNIEKPLPQLGIKQPDWFSSSSLSISIFLPYEWFKVIVQQNLDNINSTIEETSMLNGLVDGGAGFGPDSFINLNYSNPTYASDSFIFAYDQNQSALRVNTPALTEEQRVKAAYDLSVNPSEQISKVAKYKPDIILVDLCNAYGNPLIWKSNVRMSNGQLASRSEIVNRYPNVQWVEPLIAEIHKNGIKCGVYWKPLFNFLDLSDYPPAICINGVIAKYVRSTNFARSIFSVNYKNFIKDLMCETVRPISEGGLGVDLMHWDYSFMSDSLLDFSKDALDVWAKYLGYIDSEDADYVAWAFGQNNFPFPDFSLNETALRGNGDHLYAYGDREGTSLHDLINNNIGFITETHKLNLINYANVLKSKYNEILSEISLAVESASYGNAVFVPSTEWHCYVERSEAIINFNVGQYGQAMKTEFAVEPRGYHRLRPRSSFYSPEEYLNPPCSGSSVDIPPFSVLAGTKEAEIVYADINRPDMASVINLAQKLDYCGGNKTCYTWKPTHAPENPPVGSAGSANTHLTFNTNQFRPYPSGYLFGGSNTWSGDDSIIGYQRAAYQICLKNASVLDMTFLGFSGWGGDLPRGVGIDYGDGYYNQYGSVSPSKNYAFFRKTAYHQKKIKEQMKSSGLDFSKRNMYAWIAIHVSESGRQGIGTTVAYLGDGNTGGKRYLKQCQGAPSGVGSNTGSNITYRNNSLGQNWGEFYWPIIGSMEALEDRMIPNATITDEHILKEQFSGISVILIPHREWVSDLQNTKLANFKDKGGKVVYLDEVFNSPSYAIGDPRLKGRFYDLEDRDAERAKLLNYIFNICGEPPLNGSVIQSEYQTEYQNKQCSWYKYSDISSDGTFTIGAHLLNDMSWMDLRKHSVQYSERFNELDPSTVPYQSSTNPKLNGIMDYDLFGWGPNWRTEWYNNLASDPNPSDNVEAPPILSPDGRNILSFYEPLPKNMWGNPLVGGYNSKYWTTQLNIKLPANYKIVKVCKIYVNQENEPLDFGITKSSISQSLTHDPSNEISFYYDDSSKSWRITVSKIGMHCLVGIKVKKASSFLPTCKDIFAYTMYPSYTSNEFDFDYSVNFINSNVKRMHYISDDDLYGDIFDNNQIDKKYNFYSYSDNSYHADAVFNHISMMYEVSGFNSSSFDGHIGLEFNNLSQTIENALFGSENENAFIKSKNQVIDVIRDLKNILPLAKIGIINFPYIPFRSIYFDWLSMTEAEKRNLVIRSMSILESIVREVDFISINGLLNSNNLTEISFKLNYVNIVNDEIKKYIYNKNIVCDILGVVSKEFWIENDSLTNVNIDSIFQSFGFQVDGYFLHSNLRRVHYNAFIDGDVNNDSGARSRLQSVLKFNGVLTYDNSFSLINDYIRDFKNYAVTVSNNYCSTITSGLLNANKIYSIPYKGPTPPKWLKKSAKFIRASFSASDIKNAFKSIVHLLPNLSSPSPSGNCLYVSTYDFIGDFYSYESNQACSGQPSISLARTNFGISTAVENLYQRAKYYLTSFPDGIVINIHDHDEPLWWNTSTPIGQWDILSNNVEHGMNKNFLAEVISYINNNPPNVAVIADINPCAFVTLDNNVYPFAINCYGLRVEKSKGGNGRCQFRSFLNQNMVDLVYEYHKEAFNLGLRGILWNEPVVSEYGDFEYSVIDRFARYKGYAGASDPAFSVIFPFPISCGSAFGNYVLKYFNPTLPVNICKGDRNGNGIVDGSDASLFNIAASNFSTNSEDLLAFDFNGDGVVTFDGDGALFNSVVGSICYDLKCDEIIIDNNLKIPTIKELLNELPIDGEIYTQSIYNTLLDYSNFCNNIAQNGILFITNNIDITFGSGIKTVSPYVGGEYIYDFDSYNASSMSLNASSMHFSSGIVHQYSLNKANSIPENINIPELQRFSMSMGENLGLEIVSGSHGKPVFLDIVPNMWKVTDENLNSWTAFDNSNNTNIVEDGMVRDDAIRGYLSSSYFNYITKNCYPIYDMFRWSDWADENYIPGQSPVPNVLNYSDIDNDPPSNNTPFIRNILDISKKMHSSNGGFHFNFGFGKVGYQRHAWIAVHHSESGRRKLSLSNSLSANGEFYTKTYIDLSDYGYSGTLGWGEFYWPIVGSIEMCVSKGIPYTVIDDSSVNNGDFSGISVIVIPHKKLLSQNQLDKLSGFNGLVVYLDDLYGNYENIFNVWHSGTVIDGISESDKAKNSLYNYITSYIGEPPLQLTLSSDAAVATSIDSYNKKNFSVFEVVDSVPSLNRDICISISNDRSWADIRRNTADISIYDSYDRFNDLLSVNYSNSPFSSLYFNDSFYQDGSNAPVNGVFAWYSGMPPAGYGKKFTYKISLRGVEKIVSAYSITVDASTNSVTKNQLVIQRLVDHDVIFTQDISEFSYIILTVSESLLSSSSSSTPAFSSSSSTMPSSSSSTILPSSSSSRPSSSSSRPSSSSSSGFVLPSSSSSPRASSSSSVITFPSSSDEVFTFPSSSSSSRPIGSSSSVASSSTVSASSSSSYVTSPFAASYALETDTVTNVEKEFGIEYYNTGFGGSVGDSVNIDFAELQPLSIAKADSYSGIITLYSGTRVGKYDVMSFEVKNESFRFSGVVGHDVLEDSFEGVNVGLSSSLGQVQNINIVDQRINFNKFIYSDPNLISYYLQNTTGEKMIDNVIHTDFTSPDNFIDQYKSDIKFNLVAGVQEDISEIGALQDAVYLEEKKILIVGCNGFALFDNYIFELPDYSFQTGEFLLNVSLWNNQIYLFTSNQILIYDYDLNFIGYRNYNDYVGQIVSGYVSDNGIFISTSNGFYFTKYDRDAYIRISAPIIPETNVIDIIAKYSIYNNVLICLGSDIYWSSNLTEFGRIKTSSIDSRINSIYKFFNKNIIACDNGLYISSANILANSQLQATLLSNSVIENESRRFVDVIVVNISSSQDIVQSNIYAIRDDGTIFTSQDPSNYFDKINTKIEKPVRIVSYDDDLLVFSSFNVYSLNKNTVYGLRRSIL